jgi:hypothetical protein
VASARQASGAVWIKVPMPFRSNMRITTSRSPDYAHVNYRTFGSAEGITTFDPGDPARDVLNDLRHLSDPETPFATNLPVVRGRGSVSIPGPATITRLAIGTSHRSARLRISFDGRRTVDAPLAELEGSGLPARFGSALSLPGVLRWPMPFRSSADVSVVGDRAASLEAVVDSGSQLPDAVGRREAGYFRATHRQGHTAPRRPWKVMEANGKGLLVGLSATLAGPRSQRHLEGDERIVADGVALRGTGTEDFFEGGFYWFFGPRSLPLVGSPAHVVGRRGCAADCRSMYRWLVADAVPFARSLRFTLEHGDRNRVAGTYSTTALWYGP